MTQKPEWLPKGANLQHIARALDSCAQALAKEEQRRIDEAKGEEYTPAKWSFAGRQLCIATAGEGLGTLCYLLLGRAWNDILDWADEQLGPVEHEREQS